MSGNFSPEEKILRSEASVNESIATFHAAAREFDETPSPVASQNDLGMMDYEINNLNEIFDNIDTLKSSLREVQDMEKEKKRACESSQSALNNARACVTNYRVQVKFLRSLLSRIASEADSASEDTLSLPEDFMADGDVTASPINSSHGTQDKDKHIIYKSEDRSVVFCAGNEGEILSTYGDSNGNTTNTNGTSLNKKQIRALSGLKSKWQAKENVSSEMIEKDGKLKTLRLQLQETTSQLTEVQEQSKTGSGKYTEDVQVTTKKAGQLRRALLSVSTELDQNESAFMKLHKQLGQLDEEISQILDTCAYRGELSKDNVFAFVDTNLSATKAGGVKAASTEDVDVKSALEEKQSLSITRQPNEATHVFKERLESQLNKVLALETNFLTQVETASENVKQFNAQYTDTYTRRMTLEKNIAAQEAKLDTSGIDVNDDDLDELPSWANAQDGSNDNKGKNANNNNNNNNKGSKEETSPMSTTSTITTASTSSPSKASPRLSQADMAALTKNMHSAIGSSVSDALMGQIKKVEKASLPTSASRKNSLEDDLDDLCVDNVMSQEEEEAFEKEKMKLLSEGNKGGGTSGQENISLVGVFEAMQKTKTPVTEPVVVRKNEVSATAMTLSKDRDAKESSESKRQITSTLSVHTNSNEAAVDTASQNESAYKYWAVKLPPSPSATKQQMARQDVAKAKAAQTSRGTRGMALGADRVSSSSSPTGRGSNKANTSMDVNTNANANAKKNTFFASTLVGAEAKDDVVAQAKKALLGNEGATLVQVVSRLEELANELEVQKALALNAVFDEEVEAQEQEKKAATAAASEDDVVRSGNALLTTPMSSASAMKRAGQLSASRGLLDTLRKQQVELEQMRSLILSSAHDSNRPQSEFTASLQKDFRNRDHNGTSKSGGSKTGGSHLWKHFGELISQQTPSPVSYQSRASSGVRPRAHQEQNPQSTHRMSINSLYPIGHDEVKTGDGHGVESKSQLFVSPFDQEGYSTQRKIVEEKINYTNSKKDVLTLDTLKKTHFSSTEELKQTIAKVEESVIVMQDKLGALSSVEKIDPLTGFAIDENGDSLGLLQVTVLQARELPIRLKKPVDSYVEAALITPDSIVGKLDEDIKNKFSNKDETSSKELLSQIVGTLQESSQRNLNIQRTSTQRKNAFPVWRDTMVFTPVISTYQELHFKLRNHGGTASYESHEVLVDCVLPLQKLTDQMTHRFTLYCDTPKATQKGYHGFKRQWMAKVHAECSLRVEARLVYSKQSLTRFRIKQAQEKVVYLQHRLENFSSTTSIEPPLKFKSRIGNRGSRSRTRATPSEDVVRQYRQYYRHFSKKYPNATPGYSTPATAVDTVSTLTIDTSDQSAGESKSSEGSPDRIKRRSKPPLPRIVGLREKVTVTPYGIESRENYSGKVYSPTRKTTLAHKSGKQRFQEDYTGTFSQFEFHKRTSMYDTVQIDRMDMRSPVKPQQRSKSAGLASGKEGRGRGKSTDGKKGKYRLGDSPLRDEINESRMRSRSSDAANSSFGSSIRREFVLSGPVRASRTRERSNERAPFGSSSPTNRNPLGKKVERTVNVDMTGGNVKVPSAAERLHGHATMSSRKKRVDYMSVKAEAPLKTRKDAPAPSMNTPKASRQPLSDTDLYDNNDMDGVTPTSKTVMNARKVGYSVKQLAGEMTAEEARTRELEDRQEFANTLLEKAARERVEQQAVERKAKLEEDKEARRLEEEAKAYASQMRYRRTFRGAYVKVPLKSRKEKEIEAKKNGKKRFGKSPDPTAHFTLSRRFK